MGNILVSWVATGHDFIEMNNDTSDFSINENGPHYSLYRDFGGKFDIHYLLSQYNENENISADFKIKRLAGKLRNDFNKQVQIRYMGIDDILSIGTIKNKIDDLIKFQLKAMNVEVFISPGTPSMQTVWYLMGSELFNRDTIKFFRRREPRFFTNGQTPPKEYIKFDVSSYAGITNIRDNYNRATHSPYEKPFISPSFKDTYTKAIQLAGNDKTTVLLRGASGTGKRFLANYIHYQSNRKNKTLLSINCGGFREEALEHKLFGYEKGAFSNATKLTTGIFEQAKGGTVVLEDIDALPLRLQVRLASILTKKSFERLGAYTTIDLDIRFIATTTKDLYELQRNNAFNNELYYLLSVAELYLPTFIEMRRKERKSWVNHFMETTYTKLEVDYIKDISKEAWDFILDYPFSGNLKEVANMVEVLYTFCEYKVTLKDIPQQMIQDKQASILKLESVVSSHIQKVVQHTKGNISQSANLLGIDRATVRKYIKQN